MAKVSEVTIGAKFGRLTVISELIRVPGKQTRVTCRCDCGNEKTLIVGNIGLTTRSCGCVRVEATVERQTTHGLSRSAEYNIWVLIIQRCTNPSRSAYGRYGARGISICDEWLHDFAAFYEHVGPRPSPGHSIDRIDNEGSYEPGNVRWATAAEQVHNRRCRLVCKEGHRKEGDNLVIHNGSHLCRICLRRRQREYEQRVALRKKMAEVAPVLDSRRNGADGD
jgi:hypothetical protein